MLLWPGPPDEFQLVNYILLFKGTQFLNAGVLSMAKGAMQYFMCFTLHKEDVLGCIVTNGPGGRENVILGLADYLGSCVLVWIAFWELRYSVKYVRPRYLGRPATAQSSCSYTP